MVASLGTGEDFNLALKRFPAPSHAQLQQPGRCGLWKRGGSVRGPSGGTAVTQRVRRDRQAGKLGKGGVRRVAKEQEMPLSLFQVSAT